jgi:hypothetical protein
MTKKQKRKCINCKKKYKQEVASDGTVSRVCPYCKSYYTLSIDKIN